MTPRLLLASTSRYRRSLLQRLGVDFDVIDPAFDESTLQAAGLSPQAMCEQLALGKAQAAGARALHDTDTQLWVLGGDQTAECGGTLLHKPGTVEKAVEQLLFLQGREHRLWTSLVLWSPQTGRALHHTDVTRLWMRPLTAEQALRYVQADTPLDCAGSYKIEQRGVSLFSRVATDDPSAIEGLPLMATAGLLAEAGFEVW